MRFWDASGIVPLLVRQPASDSVAGIRASDPAVMVWWATPVECESALARLKRMRLLDDARAAAAHASLGGLAEEWIEIEPSDTIRDLARRLLSRHHLTSGDALQLAAALQGLETHGEFVCLDARLRRGARGEGLTVLPDTSVAGEPAPGPYARAARQRTVTRR